MKIIAVSDLHGCASFDKVADLAIRKKANVVVVAGDIQTAFAGRSARTCFHEEFLRPVARLSKEGIEVVAIPGNHDFYLQECLGSDGHKRFWSNLHILCDRREKILGKTFYGTPWVPLINGRWCYEEDDDDLMDRFSKIPSGVDFLIAHSPPLGRSGEMWDVSLQNRSDYWEHFGSLSLRKAIEEKTPKCVICGHIHSGEHRLRSIGGSALINVSLIDERYEEAYAPAQIIVEENGKMKFKTGGSRKWEIWKNISTR